METAAILPLLAQFHRCSWGPAGEQSSQTFVLEPHAAFCLCPAKAVLLCPASGCVLALLALRRVEGLGSRLGVGRWSQELSQSRLLLGWCVR